MNQANHLPIKSLKEQRSFAQGKQNMKSTCPMGKLEFKLFLALQSRYFIIVQW